MAPILLAAVTAASVSAASETYAIFKSKDGGQSWVRSDLGMTGRSRINAFGSADGVLFAGTDSGIFCSRNEARSWEAVKGSGISPIRILSFASIGAKVFAGTDNQGVHVSSDGGASWAIDPKFPSRKVRCLLALRENLYAGTDSEGVFTSADGGQTWTSHSAGLPSDVQVFAMTEVEGMLFAGLYTRGLYAWDRQKHSWSKVGGVTPLALASVGGTLVAGHNPGGLHWSSDFGLTWMKGIAAIQPASSFESTFAPDTGELSSEAPIWEMGSNDRLVFAGASAGIYYSRDMGRNWIRARKGLPEQTPAIAFLAKQAFVLAAAPIQ